MFKEEQVVVARLHKYALQVVRLGKGDPAQVAPT
jgi:hypothetical protein